MSVHFPLFFALLLSASLVHAQKGIRRDLRFFQNRAADYQTWLSDNALGRFFSLDKVSAGQDKVSLTLLAHFSGPKAGDSLRTAWRALRRQYHAETRQELHAAMLSKMAFQLELPLDSAEIILRTPGSKYYVRIYGEREGAARITARWEEFGDNGMGSGTISIPVGQLNDVFRGGNTKARRGRGRRFVPRPAHGAGVFPGKL